MAAQRERASYERSISYNDGVVSDLICDGNREVAGRDRDSLSLSWAYLLRRARRTRERRRRASKDR
jgi:hypothetical protein